MSRNKRFVIVAIVFVVMVGGFFVGYLLGWKSHFGVVIRNSQYDEFENNSHALVLFSRSVKSGGVNVKLQNMNGKPLAGVKVDIRNNSGGNTGVTDDYGMVLIQVSESDIEQVVINNIIVVNRPNAYANGYPNVNECGNILIIKK